MIARRRYCRTCGAAHTAWFTVWEGEERDYHHFQYFDQGATTCACGQPLNESNTSVFRTEEEAARARAEIQVVLVPGASGLTVDDETKGTNR